MIAERPRACQTGQLLPLFALLLPLLLLPVTALAVDGGVLLLDHAQLIATAQAAAEAGSQAVNVNLLKTTGEFAVCEAPLGRGDCGNGIGGAAGVVTAVVSAQLSGVAGLCVTEASVPLRPLAGRPQGCVLAVRTRCQRFLGVIGVEQGIAVLVWRSGQMPLLGLGPWSQLRIEARATAWLAHGYATPVVTGSPAGATC